VTIGASQRRVQVTDGVEVVSVDANNRMEVVEPSAAAIKSAVEKMDDPVSGSEMLIAGGATQANDVKVTLDGEVAKTEGNVAHDTADSGGPVKQGAKAVAHGSSPTAVAAGDRTDLYANRHGVPFVIGGHPNVQRAEGIRITAGTDTIATPAGGKRFVVTAVSAYSANGGLNNIGVELKIGSLRIVKHPRIAPGSGFVEGSGAGILCIGAVDAAIELVTTVHDGTIYAYVSYYEIET